MGDTLAYDTAGQFTAYEACSIGKMRWKDANEGWRGGRVLSGERRYEDLSSRIGKSYEGSQLWG